MENDEIIMENLIGQHTLQINELNSQLESQKESIIRDRIESDLYSMFYEILNGYLHL